MLTIDAVVSSMERQKAWYWVIKDSKGLVREKNLTVENADESENWLREAVDALEDGAFKIELRTHPNNSKGNTTLAFSVGEVGTAAVGSVRNDRAAAPVRTNLMEQFLFAQIGNNSDEARRLRDENARLQREVDKIRYEADKKEWKRELERIREEQIPEPTTFDRLAGILDTPAGLKIVERIFPGGTPIAAAAIGLKSAPVGAQVEPDEYEGDGDGPDDLADLPLTHEPGTVSIDAMIDAQHRVKAVFPQWNFNILLAKLARYAEQNPAMAKNVLESL